MKHQQVSVDFWAMVKTMLIYGALSVAGWIMMRLFNTVFMLPARMRRQQNSIENTLRELQRRYPDLNFTEEELKEAEKEFETWNKEIEEQKKNDSDTSAVNPEKPAATEDKKTI